MNISFGATALVAASMAFSSGVQAQDQSVDWSGAYVGAFAEGSLSSFDMHDKDCWYCASGSFTEATPEFGAKVGYDWQVGSLVYGVSASVSSGPDSASRVWWDNADFISELKSMAAVRGRIGYAVDKNLFYSSIGLLSGIFSGIVGFDGGGEDYSDVAVDDERRNGISFGIGFARMLADNLALELEGEYQTFETGYSHMYRTSDGSQQVGEIGFGLSRTVVRAGLTYRF